MAENKYRLKTYSMRLEIELLEKLNYIAKYNGCPLKEEILSLMKYHVADFERQHGEININSDKIT